MDATIERVLDWLGRKEPPLLEQLAVFQQWLVREAIPAGGLGPAEEVRLARRHVADSLLFGGVWDPTGGRLVVDIGTGVGLPGIPLAIAFPERRFLLVDRSGRRVSLARRAVRILDLADRIEILQADAGTVDLKGATVVSRASLPPRLLAGLRTRGAAEVIVGGSHVVRPEVDGFTTVEVPSEILDRPVWLLRMARL